MSERATFAPEAETRAEGGLDNELRTAEDELLEAIEGASENDKQAIMELINMQPSRQQLDRGEFWTDQDRASRYFDKMSSRDRKGKPSGGVGGFDKRLDDPGLADKIREYFLKVEEAYRENEE